MWTYVYSDELYHHGTKGMKWGRRLYQNKDGSLTPLGKVRYKTNDKFRGQVNKERALAKARATKAANKTIEEKRAELLKSVDAKEIYENKHLLTTQELNDRINRIDTEARLQSKIVTEQQKSGMDYVNDKMSSSKKALDNAVGLYKSVDEAYKTVTSSAIGKTLAKKLGLEPPKKEFDLDDFVKNINKKSSQEIEEVSKRVENEKKIRTAKEELAKRQKEEAAEKTMQDEAKKAAKEAAKEAKQAKKEAQKQVDDYNKKLQEDYEESYRKATDESSRYRMKSGEINDNRTWTKKPPANDSRTLLLEQIDRYEPTGKDVVGKGTSKFTGWDDGPVVDAVYDGEKYVTSLLQLEDKGGKR